MKNLSGQNIAIIGAGLAGVAAAQCMRQRSASVVLFEKSRGFGGRCASKRWDGHVVDHGAQYFTLRDELFKNAVLEACGDSILRLNAPVFDENGSLIPDGGRWYHAHGNSRLARDLAAGLRVVTEHTVEDARVLLKANGGMFDHVISTAPWPQTAALFGLEADAEYIPCLAAVFSFHGEWLGKTRHAYAVSDHSSEMLWTACENHKIGRVAPGCTVIVAQMDEAFSRKHLESPPAEYPALIQTMVEECWGIPSSALRSAFGHRWRMARVARPIVPGALPAGLHFTGDATRSSRVEDAWLAGYELGRSDVFAP